MMFDYLSMHLDTAKFMVKTNKKAIRCHISMLVFNISFLIWDFYAGIVLNSLTSQACIGAMVINVIWTLGFLIEAWGEQKRDKELLHFYEKRKAEKNMVEAYEEYKKSKDFYDTAYKNILEEYIKSKPEDAKQGNSGFQPSILPNCT